MKMIEMPAVERLDDIGHMDELNRMKDRIFGLEAAINHICDPAIAFEAGVCQLASDISNAMAACAAAFEVEMELQRTPEHCEWLRKAGLAQGKPTWEFGLAFRAFSALSGRASASIWANW
jgi:hypothetical protein